MELRKIPEPHWCVVKLLQKKDMVALFERLTPKFCKSQAWYVCTPIWENMCPSGSLIYVYVWQSSRQTQTRDLWIFQLHEPDMRASHQVIRAMEHLTWESWTPHLLRNQSPVVRFMRGSGGNIINILSAQMSKERTKCWLVTSRHQNWRRQSWSLQGSRTGLELLTSR